ncbi:MAG: GNAT family N-acetyltransferase [Bacteroidetes bacterium]|nr:GNAT family N-acetyltransferase [Fibrella sp.]
MLTHRLARPGDVRVYFDWANDPDTRQQSFQTDPIPFATHQAWFSRKLADPNALLLVFEHDGQPIGQVRIERSTGENVIGISLDIAFRGKGLSVPLLNQATAAFFAHFPDEQLIHAYIKPDNRASARAFERAGFRLSGETGKFVDTDGVASLLFTLTKPSCSPEQPKA